MEARHPHGCEWTFVGGSAPIPSPAARPWEMTPLEFAQHPSTWWHGSPNSEVGRVIAAQGLHVGTYEAARQAVKARAGWDPGPFRNLREADLAKELFATPMLRDKSEVDGDAYSHLRALTKCLVTYRLRLEDDVLVMEGFALSAEDAFMRESVPGCVMSLADKYWLGFSFDGETRRAPGPPSRPALASASVYDAPGVTADGDAPSMTPAWVTGPMSNSPYSPHEDFAANGRMRGLLARGKARQGYYYSNVSEDEGSVSVVVPSRAHLSTHGDFTLKAISEGHDVPASNSSLYWDSTRAVPTGNADVALPGGL